MGCGYPFCYSFDFALRIKSFLQLVMNRSANLATGKSGDLVLAMHIFNYLGFFLLVT